MNDITINKCVLKTNLPEMNEVRPVLFLIHGWTGDENSMTVFVKRLQTHYAVFAPRGFVSAPSGGYGWHIHQSGQFPRLAEFKPAMEAVLGLLDNLAGVYPHLDFRQPSWMGFSQGGALVYSLALNYPERISKLAGLASFIPTEALPCVEHKPLAGKSVFVAHGTKDQVVPMARARQTVELLQRAGAQVEFCEGFTGHSVGLDCIRGMERFFGLQDGHSTEEEGDQQ